MSGTSAATGIVAVAARAGVAPSTVSRYANSPGKVSPALAARIQRAMEELRYRPNPHARALRAGATETVYVVFDTSDGSPRLAGVFRNQPDALERSAAIGCALIVESPLQ